MNQKHKNRFLNEDLQMCMSKGKLTSGRIKDFDDSKVQYFI